MRRSPMQALAASPTMVGAVTTLIVVVAVFLAYNAHEGLPFVPVYRVSVEVPNASRLVTHNEVRIGGNRVGVIESIDAVRREHDASAQGSETDAGPEIAEGGPGDAVARLNLKLDKAAEPLPLDSVFRIRYRSSFGLKYLEITRGDSEETADEGFVFDGVDTTRDGRTTLSLEDLEDRPSDQAAFIEQTEFDDIGNTFDQRTRNAVRLNLLDFGNAFAARGGSLNVAISSLRPLLGNLKPVAETLTEPETRFRRLFPALAEAARIVAPVAPQQAELFTNMAITFAAISADPEALKETISETPPTLETGIRTLPAQQTLLAELADLSVRLGPGAGELRAALPELNRAVAVGTPVLARSPQLNRRLRSVLRELERLVAEPSTLTSLERLERTFNAAAPLARYVAPAQTVCNYWNYWFTLFPEHLSERDSVGFTQRQSIITTPEGPLTVDLGAGVPVTLPGQVETGMSIGGYSGLQANAKAGLLSTSPGEFQPHELPILQGDPGKPTGQDGNDCQGGQTGYILGDLRLPGQSPSNPAVGVPNRPGGGPTTAYWLQDGTRIQRDSRVEERQP